MRSVIDELPVRCPLCDSSKLHFALSAAQRSDDSSWWASILTVAICFPTHSRSRNSKQPLSRKHDVGGSDFSGAYHTRLVRTEINLWRISHKCQCDCAIFHGCSTCRASLISFC